MAHTCIAWVLRECCAVMCGVPLAFTFRMRSTRMPLRSSTSRNLPDARRVRVRAADIDTIPHKPEAHECKKHKWAGSSRAKKETRQGYKRETQTLSFPPTHVLSINHTHASVLCCLCHPPLTCSLRHTRRLCGRAPRGFHEVVCFSVLYPSLSLPHPLSIETPLAMQRHKSNSPQQPARVDWTHLNVVQCL